MYRFIFDADSLQGEMVSVTINMTGFRQGLPARFRLRRIAAAVIMRLIISVRTFRKSAQGGIAYDDPAKANDIIGKQKVNWRMPCEGRKEVLKWPEPDGKI